MLAGASIGCHPHCINLAAHTAALADMQRKLKKKVLVKNFQKFKHVMLSRRRFLAVSSHTKMPRAS